MIKSLKEIKSEKTNEALPRQIKTVTWYRPVYQIQGVSLASPNCFLLEDCFLYESAELARNNPNNKNKTVVGVTPVVVEVLS